MSVSDESGYGEALEALKRLEEERKDIERLVGRYILLTAELDNILAAMIGIHDHSGPVGPVDFTDARGLFVARKLDRVRSILPPGWPETSRLLNQLQEVFDYRNQLSHSTLGYDHSVQPFWAEGHKLFGLRTGRYRQIDPDELTSKVAHLEHVLLFWGLLEPCMSIRRPNEHFDSAVQLLASVMPLDTNTPFWTSAAYVLGRPDLLSAPSV